MSVVDLDLVVFYLVCAFATSVFLIGLYVVLTPQVAVVRADGLLLAAVGAVLLLYTTMAAHPYLLTAVP